MTSGSSMQAMTRSVPPHLGQVSMSMEKTRFRHCIGVMGASGWSGLGCSGSRLGTMRSRCLQFGANTPWQRVRLSLGRGASAARRAITADITDYDQVQSGSGRAGLYYALLTLTSKIGYAAALITYPVLEWLGYEPGAC